MRLVQFDFPMDGPWGPEMSAVFAPLADEIAGTPGLVWKIWTEDAATGRGGGIYLFADEGSAERYVAEHTARLAGFGITGVRALRFDVNEELTAVTRGPLAPASP